MGFSDELSSSLEQNIKMIVLHETFRFHAKSLCSFSFCWVWWEFLEEVASLRSEQLITFCTLLAWFSLAVHLEGCSLAYMWMNIHTSTLFFFLNLRTISHLVLTLQPNGVQDIYWLLWPGIEFLLVKMKHTQIRPMEHGASREMSHKFRYAQEESKVGFNSLSASQMLQ